MELIGGFIDPCYIYAVDKALIAPLGDVKLSQALNFIETLL